MKLHERAIINECAAFLDTIRKPAIVGVPYPESKLHELSESELKDKIYEASRSAHMIPQFSAQETAYFEFIDEASTVLKYKQLDELSKSTLGSYVNKAAKEATVKSATASGLLNKMPATWSEKEKLSDAAFDSREKSRGRLKGIKAAVSKLTKEDQDIIDSIEGMFQIDENK